MNDTKPAQATDDAARFTIPPVRKSVRVTCPPAEAFLRFTRDIGRWWPSAEYSIGGAEVELVAIEPKVGGRIFERLQNGDEHVWGSVIRWNPPAEVAFTWHAARVPETAQEISITFHAHPDGSTQVDLVHAGWQHFGAGAEVARGEYEGGWEEVFVRRYKEFAHRCAA